MNAGRSPLLEVLASGIDRVADRLRAEWRDDLRAALRPLQQRLYALEQGQQQELRRSVSDAELRRIAREAERSGEWRPWEWADELGISEAELRQMLGHERDRLAG